MKDRFGHILYVGKAKDLKKRVSSYFQPGRRPSIAQPKVEAMLELVAEVDWLVVRSEAEALLLESKLIKDWRPKYNTDLRDDKRFLLVKVNLQAEMPQFRLVRNRLEDGARYFGPFAHSGAIRALLKDLRKRLGVLLGDTHPKPLADGSYQLYDDIRGELYGPVNQVTQSEYRQQVEAACLFLEGKTKAYREEVRAAMALAAAAQDYEKAAQLRDQLFALEDTLSPTRRFKREPMGLPGGADEAALVGLQAALGLATLPQVIEGFDISHISGTFTVASMVYFARGVAVKAQYRRYKIQSFEGNDDFRSMAEVVARRYHRLSTEGKAFPDLILIDGGLGQVNAALTAFAVLNLTPPFLVGLAKKEETLVFSDGRTLKLPLRHPGLRLLQRVRDEAHRFANRYNADLRSKKIRESVLDTIPGLGPKKRLMLLQYFKTLDNIQAADKAALAAAPGIGPKLAEILYTGLRVPK